MLINKYSHTDDDDDDNDDDDAYRIYSDLFRMCCNVPQIAIHLIII